ncbi:hypothetical protein B0T10DRAFT_465405 [Thelonectria olida]|uniref:Uncharacterized protein n=1 Tax=Thelonectria olida TaxID=1576542 RepID=A0A9P8VVY2_9HYPO|nr:hypothetical protein B0T10DRAFT_465405 [Thelonectria olida]
MDASMSWRDIYVFDATCKVMNWNRSLKRRHAQFCNPCTHSVHGEEMTDEYLWSQWKPDMRLFFRALLIQAKRLIGDDSPDSDLDNLDQRDLLEFSFDLMDRFDANRPVWDKRPEYLCYHNTPSVSNLDATELSKVDRQLYEFAASKTGMTPVPGEPDRDNTDLVRTVVFAFGLLGWIGLWAEPTDLISQRSGPLPPNERGDTVLMLLPHHFLMRVVNELLEMIDNEIPI